MRRRLLALASPLSRYLSRSAKVSFSYGFVKLGMIFISIKRVELVYKLLASMPRAQIARVHRRIAPSVQVDIVGVSEPSVHNFVLTNSLDVLDSTIGAGIADFHPFTVADGFDMRARVPPMAHPCG